jgi:hypothetical protein
MHGVFFEIGKRWQSSERFGYRLAASVSMALQREFLSFPHRIFALSQISANLPVHAGGFFFGLCRARRRPVGVAGVTFELTFFGAFIAAGGEPKRAAHFCSKRL